MTKRGNRASKANAGHKNRRLKTITKFNPSIFLQDSSGPRHCSETFFAGAPRTPSCRAARVTIRKLSAPRKELTVEQYVVTGTDVTTPCRRNTQSITVSGQDL